MTTIFGNPGSNELPFLADIPDDFDYVLACTRARWSAWPTGTPRPRAGPAFVNLHAGRGHGQRDGRADQFGRTRTARW